MENNNYNNNGYNNQEGSQNENSAAQANGMNGTQDQAGGQQGNSSTYSYSYLNQEQRNPNNVWRAEENTFHANSSDANSYHQTNAYGSAQANTGAYNGAEQAQQSTEQAYSSIYGTPNQNGNWNTYSDAKKQKKEERARKRAEKNAASTSGSNFGIKLAKCASIALIFGLVSGTAFEGSSYVAGNLFGTNQSESNAVDDKEEKEVLKTTDSSQDSAPLSATPASLEDGISAIVKQCKPSIVAITSVSQVQSQNWFGQVQSYEVPSAGSGIIVAEDDNNLYIATNNHVVTSATTLTIQFCDDETATAEIKGTDVSTDLAVVQVKKSDIKADTLSQIKIATMGDSDKIEVGSRAIAIGNALGYGQSVTGGFISAVEREVTMEDEKTGETFTNDLIQTDAAINPGNSGGALLNINGEVIGINSSKYSDTTVEGMGFAIPSNMAKPIIEDLITKSEVSADKAAYLGISGEDVTAAVAAAYNMPEGLFIKEVYRGTAAEKYGLQKGDIITKFDGRKIKSWDTLVQRLSYYAAGEEVEIEIQRPSQGSYEEMTITVVLGKKDTK